MTALLEREKSGKGQWVQSILLQSQHRAARLPGGALPDEGRSAAAGRQRPSDQHADLGVQDRGRLHQRRRHRAKACGSALCKAHRARGPARARGVQGRARTARRTASRSTPRSTRRSQRGHSAEWIEIAQRGERALRADLHHRPGVRRSAGAAHRRGGDR